MKLTRDEKWACLNAVERIIERRGKMIEDAIPGRAAYSARDKLREELKLLPADEGEPNG